MRIEKAFIIVATKGRAQDCAALMNCITRQTLRPTFTLFVATEPSDISGLHEHPWTQNGMAAAIVSPKVGLTSQRNFGIETLEQMGFFTNQNEKFFCAFFDDDFRMADDWLEQAGARLGAGDNIVGLTGCVLADGACTGLTGTRFSPNGAKGELTEDIAAAFIKGEREPVPHWSSGPNERDIDSVYGCNMAFSDRVIRTIRFDENVPFYGWQEDRDYTGMAKKCGRVVYTPQCKGVHLATKSGGRASGVKFGYSQIANPIYFVKKGTIQSKHACKLAGFNVLSNIVHSTVNHPTTDYRGRLKGNLIALKDILRGKLDPKKILAL